MYIHTKNTHPNNKLIYCSSGNSSHDNNIFNILDFNGIWSRKYEFNPWLECSVVPQSGSVNLKKSSGENPPYKNAQCAVQIRKASSPSASPPPPTTAGPKTGMRDNVILLCSKIKCTCCYIYWSNSIKIWPSACENGRESYKKRHPPPIIISIATTTRLWI